LADKNDINDFIIDFSKEERGGQFHTKPGKYKVKILKAVPTKASTGTACLEMTMIFLDGKNKKKKMVERMYLTEKTFFRARNLLEACGKDVPDKGKFRLPAVAKAVTGQIIYVDLDDEVDESGQYPVKSRVRMRGGFLSVENVEEDVDDDDEDTDDDDDEDTEDDTDDDDEDEDDDELDLDEL